MFQVCRLRRHAVVFLALSTFGISVADGALPVFGGPTYDPVTKSGVKAPFLSHSPGATAGNGVGLMYAETYTAGDYYIGDRGYRWTNAGTTLQLGTIGTDSNGFALTLAYAINANNVAVGGATKFNGDTSLRFRAVRWNANGVATELGALPGSAAGNAEATAFAINAGGTAVGYGYKPAGDSDQGFRAVRWSSTGTAATELGNLGLDGSGYGEARANAINTAGVTIGYSRKYVGGALKGNRAVRWNAGSATAVELGNIGTNTSGSANNVAVAVNDAGTAVGYAYKFPAGSNVSTGLRGVRWDASGTAATELLPINFDSTGYSDSQANDVNSAGLTVGYSNKYNASGASIGTRAVRWNPATGTAVELGNLGVDSAGYTTSEAYAVNSSGVAVGTTGLVSHARATYWGADGVAVDLNLRLAFNTGWTLFEAVDITDTGWITINATFDPDGAGPKPAAGRPALVLVPQAGTYGTGDADFNTSVNFNDLTILAQHYNQANASLATGVADFDLNGQTNFNDLVTLAQHYSSGGASVEGIGDAGFAADWALAQSLVPEPAAIVVFAVSGVLVRRRRNSSR